MVGLKYKSLKEYDTTDWKYNYNYVISIGDIIEIININSTSYAVRLNVRYDPSILLRVPKGILEDKTYFKPYFRDKNLDDILQ